MAKKDETTDQTGTLQGAQIGAAAAQAQLGHDPQGYSQAQNQVGFVYHPYANVDYAARSARELALGSAMGLKPENAVAALRAAKKFETYLLTGTVEE